MRILRESGRQPTPIYNNCSGKHSGMLAQALYRGLSIDDYLDPRHPVQVAILTTLAEMGDLDPNGIEIGIDGCSVPCFAIPLRACALAFARLADPSALPALRRAAIERIVKAMTTYPEMVAGEDRLDTDLMRAAHGRVLSKGGAEGYHGMALIPKGLGIAMKIVDGNGQRGSGPAVIETLRQLGALDDQALEDLCAYRSSALTNHRNLEVGEIRPSVKLFDVANVL
jgi:L-asparaginase II